MKQHAGLLVVTGLAVFSFTVAAALNSPPIPADTEQARLQQQLDNLERASEAEIAELEEQQDALKEWADDRLTPWVNRVARLQDKLANAIIEAGIPLPTVEPLPPVGPLPPPPSVSPTPLPDPPDLPSPPSPSCIPLPISNVCIGTPDPPGRP
jgi:hypothetical protein